MGVHKNKSIKDVAKLAGVSLTTVSRVINNSDHPVNNKTKEKVQAAIEKLNFLPNRMAQGLIKNKSQLIGVIVHDISDPYFAEMVRGIEEVVFNYDYIVNIYNTGRTIDKELRSVEMLKANRADAVVFTGATFLDERYKKVMEGYIQELQNMGSIVTSVTSHPFGVKNIEIDNTYEAHVVASYKISSYLIKMGHKDIIYVNGPEMLSTSEERLIGYQKAMNEAGLTLDENKILKGDFTFEGGRKAAIKLLDHARDVTAIVAANDETALGILWELKNQGIDVPGDFSVVGIGNISTAKYSYPPLTTVSLPIYRIGIKIGRYIINLLENTDLNTDIETQIQLVERDSVRTQD